MSFATLTAAPFVPHASADVVTTRRGIAYQPDGRLGHEVKNVLSGMVLAAALNYSYNPPARDGPWGFGDVDGVLELRRLAGSPRLHSQDAAPTDPGRHAGRCPDGWPLTTLNASGFGGIADFGALLEHVRARTRA